jgi:hypothetical protein
MEEMKPCQLIGQIIGFSQCTFLCPCVSLSRSFENLSIVAFGNVIGFGLKNTRTNGEEKEKNVCTKKRFSFIVSYNNNYYYSEDTLCIL